ncbi:PREDICTED: EPIDERMAL PATTERNING FACTOR-like protein 6 isoform X2 [Tarenaya hassleriana]|uniref:EPIDERMAL PATTERNING FACTOR-like protein 6 isoform X2 n=1 Tax=Tarenaya hassleriana TaxID=28532 RepID=UPI00053C3EE0|nr:PREDICTED: EPIDERMAL PATTERNING FACTOR-like protein 6 isoform X2 [Tarenaya hassleriana]
MGPERRSSSSTNCRSKFTLSVFFLCLFFLCAIAPSPPSPYIRNSFSGKLATFYPQMRGRRMRGMGSWPPRCTGKCGRCTPCKPVHVPVPPGTPVTAEYYPEAWRCKCRNKLYMP